MKRRKCCQSNYRIGFFSYCRLLIEEAPVLPKNEHILEINTFRRKKSKVKRSRRKQKRKKMRRLSKRKKERLNY
jgi:hypothetical protein